MKLFISQYAYEPDPEDIPYLDVPLDYSDGTYFFLYPYLLQLRDETGQDVDPQGTAHFEPSHLPIVIRQFEAAHEAARQNPETFKQHVARQFSPSSGEVYADVTRSTLVTIIENVLAAVREAKGKHWHVYLVGE